MDPIVHKGLKDAYKRLHVFPCKDLGCPGDSLLDPTPEKVLKHRMLTTCGEYLIGLGQFYVAFILALILAHVNGGEVPIVPFGFLALMALRSLVVQRYLVDGGVCDMCR